MWLLLALLSALCLGFYDISKKRALRDYDVATTLLITTGISSLLMTPILLLSICAPDWVMSHMPLLYVPTVSAHEHLRILLKSLIVLSSWICAYAAMKHLPITLVAPINATRPMWTLLGALLLFGEVLNFWQGLGITIALISFFCFSIAGKREGISLSNRDNRIWILLLILGTLLGACSGLYDKYLMRHLDHNAVLIFYTYYQFLLMIPITYVLSLRSPRLHLRLRLRLRSGSAALRFRFRNASAALRFRLRSGPAALRFRLRSGPAALRFRFRNASAALFCISLFLMLADFVYLLSLTYPDSLISVVSTLRRGSVLIAFAYGALVIREKNIGIKFLCLCGVLAGMICLLLGSLNI